MGLILLRCIFFAFSFVRLPEVSVTQFQQVWWLSVAVLPSNAPTMPSMNTFHGVVWKLAECKTCPDIQVIVYFSHFLITSLFSSGYLVVFSDTIKIDQSDPKFSFNRTAILLPLTFKALPFPSGKRPMNILRLDFFLIFIKFCFCCFTGFGWDGVIFFLIGHILLVLGLWLRPLIAHQYFGCFWVVFAQCQGFLCFSQGLCSDKAGVNKKLGGDTDRRSDLSWPKGYSMTYIVLSNKNAGEFFGRI